MRGTGHIQSLRTKTEYLNRMVICLVIFAGASNTSQTYKSNKHYDLLVTNPLWYQQLQEPQSMAQEMFVLAVCNKAGTQRNTNSNVERSFRGMNPKWLLFMLRHG